MIRATNKYNKPSLAVKLFMVMALLVLFAACEKEATEEPIVDRCNPSQVRGELIETRYTMSVTPDQLQTILSQSGGAIPFGLVLDYTVDIYTLSYLTLDKDSVLSPVSGVLFIPRGLDTLDLLSTQHGTTFKRDQVGSVNAVYALDGMITAMNGYLVVSPDYLGLGVSLGLHPYLHAELSANPVVDIIRAARKYACQNDLILSDKLFLAGYSEGGYVTLATQKIMEKDYADEFHLTAVAPMAGPHDLLGTTLNLLTRHYYDNPAYLVYLVAAYNEIYGWDQLTYIFQEPYASAVPGLLTGDLSGAEINAQLTTDLDSLFNPVFKNSFLAGDEEVLEAALRNNSTLDWGPIAPVRLIHGTADSTVFYDNSVVAYESMLANGGLSVDLIPLFGANHETAAFPAYYFAIQWFDSLRATNE